MKDVMKMIAEIESMLSKLKAAVGGEHMEDMGEEEEIEVEADEEEEGADEGKKKILSSMLKKKYGA